MSERSRVDDSTERRAARASHSQRSGRKLSGGRYRVVAGDTLYSIAWRYRRDFRDLAALNNIPAPFEIYPGQVLKVRGKAPTRVASTSRTKSKPASGGRQRPPPHPQPHPMASTRTKPQSGSAAASAPGTTSSKTPAKQPGPARSTASAARSKPQASVPRTGPVALRWPSSGKRVRAFGSKPSDSAKPSNNVDFALQPGASIRAAGAGEVVFARASLAGYRQFVILKHNDTWLSSYGFNAPLQVREGQRVTAGATLATLGRVTSGTPNERVLRFEVRKDGTAVNPASVIGR